MPRGALLRVRLPRDPRHGGMLPVAWAATATAHVAPPDIASVIAESLVEGVINAGEYPLFPALAHVPWVHRQDVELILLVNRQLVLSALVIFPVPIDSEVLNQHSVRKTEIRVPQADLPAVQDGGWLFIYERQAVFVEQRPYPVFTQRSVGCIASPCASVAAKRIFDHADMPRSLYLYKAFGCQRRPT